MREPLLGVVFGERPADDFDFRWVSVGGRNGNTHVYNENLRPCGRRLTLVLNCLLQELTHVAPDNAIFVKKNRYPEDPSEEGPIAPRAYLR